MNDPNKLRSEILRLTREYSRQVHAKYRPGYDINRENWEMGDNIPYAGRDYRDEVKQR